MHEYGGRWVHVTGYAFNPGKGLPVIERERGGFRGDGVFWLVVVPMWPKEVEGKRISLVGQVFHASPPVSKTGTPVQW